MKFFICNLLIGAFVLLLFTVNVEAQNFYPQTKTLDGNWKFAVDTSGKLSIENLEGNAVWRNAKVPLSWQAQFYDLRDYQGVGWYKKDFSIRKLKNDETAIIHFGAVDYLSEIYVNGIFTGKHEGGYLPFDFDIGKNLKPGKNEIVVRVMDPKATKEGTEGISYWNIPHGKQSWYVQTSGIWQSVSIKIEPKKFINQIHITPSLDGSFVIDGKFNSALNESGKKVLQLKILDAYNKVVFKVSHDILNSDTSFNLEGKISLPKLWSFESPNLYSVEIIFDGKSKSEIQFGFRSIEAKDKKLYLNGKPFYLMAALDQDFYPETIYTTPSEKYIRDELLKAKKLGLNTLRCHIKVPDPIYLKAADEVGLLVWYEIPNWDVLNDGAKIRSKETLEGMLARDWNHPSLVIISLINESWGIDLQKADQREWLKSEFNFAKEKAKGRLIVDNSACYGNFHIKTDLNDYHTYYSIPENFKQFDETINEVNNRPKWLFSSFGDAEETGEEPLLISEFGNWGLPQLPKKLPWWFDRKFGNVEPAMPAGVTNRFKEFYYDNIFASYNQLTTESQRAQFTALKYEIEQIRLSPQIQGYVITEFTDINWETNGLMDMWRHPKVYAKELSNIQQQDVIIPRVEKYNYWNGDTAKIKIFFSHYSDSKLGNIFLDWKSSDGNKGEVKIPVLDAREVKQIAEINFPVRALKNFNRIKINYEVRSNGKIYARNYSEIFAYPELKHDQINAEVYDPLNKLESISSYLSENKLISAFGNMSLIITNEIDEPILQKLKSGENVLCLIDSTTKLPQSFPFKLTNRNRDLFDGNWITNFNWLRDGRQPFNKFNFGKFSGFEAVNCEPQIAITDIQPKDFEDVLAGMFVGWIHLNSVYIVQMNVGKGKLLFCTFPINKSIEHDPYTETLFQKLINYVNGGNFSPKFSLMVN